MKPTTRQVYSNDRKAPRMRKAKFSKMVITKELFKRFKEEYIEYKDMSWDEFFQNWKDIAETIRHETIYNPLGTKLEKFTGELKLQYLPYKFKANSFNDSEELGEKVNFLNITTRGKVAKLKWERRWAVRYNKMLQFYAFNETRELKEMAKNYILSNPNGLRTSRNTLGGISIWRQKRNK